MYDLLIVGNAAATGVPNVQLPVPPVITVTTDDDVLAPSAVVAVMVAVPENAASARISQLQLAAHTEVCDRACRTSASP